MNTGLHLRRSVTRVGIGLAICFVGASCNKNYETGQGLDLGMDVGNVECISNAGTTIQNYFSGTGSMAEVHSMWACANQILVDFTTYTVGANPNGYTAAELQGFLSRYYIKSGLSNDATNSTLKLKQAIVGGASDFVTRDEIQKLGDAISMLDSVMTELYPAVKNLFTAAGNTAPESDWFAAQQNLSASLLKISNFIAQNGATYQFADLHTLLTSWGAQLNLPSGHLVYKMANLVPTLGLAKAILIAGSSTGLTPKEWQPFSQSGASVYSLYRMWLRISPTSDISALLGSSRLLWLAQNAVATMNTGIQRRPGNQIPVTEIQNFLNSLQTAGYFPQAFTANQFTSAIQFLINKVFSAPAAIQDVFGATTIAQIQKLLNNWSAYDAALISGDFSNAAEFFTAISPLSLDDSGRLELPATARGVFHEYSAIFAVLEWIGNQWGSWPVSSSTFDTVVSDFLNVIHALGFLPATQASVSTQLLREADLFMIASDGAVQLEKAETFQFAIYILSSYRQSLMLNTLTASCAGNVGCITAGFTANSAALLANFPNLVHWLQADQTRWATFQTDVANAAGGTDQWIMQFVVIHFIETYLVRFDSNNDQLIDFSESMVGFPVYQPALDILIPPKGLPVTDDKPMYTYLFKHGGPPAGWLQDVDYLVWRIDPTEWTYDSDRMILAGILNALRSF